MESYVYPATSNRLASVTSASAPRAFGYDAAGNITSDTRGAQAYGYAYDPAGRLTSVSLNGVAQADYRYDWRGQQAMRRFPASGQAIHSVFDSAGHRIAEYNEGTGALIRAYVWLGDRPLAVIEGGQVYYVRTDQIGRPVFATTSSGTVIWTASYLPFGGVHVVTGAPIDLRFPGQWFQAEAGLHQNWMRDYDPTTGRYIEPDPLGLIDGASVYGYARQNPGRWTDPRGENPAAAAAAVCEVFPAACAAAGQAISRICIEGAKIVVGAALGVLSSATEGCACDNKCSPSESPVWRGYMPHIGKTKTNGLPGKARRYYQWDYTHCNIEVYDRRGEHVGVQDAQTGAMIGQAVSGRRISLI